MVSPLRLTRREIVAWSPLFEAPPSRTATASASEHHRLESELGFTLNWLLSQENNFFFSPYYLMFVLTWKWYAVSSG